MGDTHYARSPFIAECGATNVNTTDGIIPVTCVPCLRKRYDRSAADNERADAAEARVRELIDELATERKWHYEQADKAHAAEAEVARLRGWLRELLSDIKECVKDSLDEFGGAVHPDCPECHVSMGREPRHAPDCALVKATTEETQ